MRYVALFWIVLVLLMATSVNATITDSDYMHVYPFDNNSYPISYDWVAQHDMNGSGYVLQSGLLGDYAVNFDSSTDFIGNTSLVYNWQDSFAIEFWLNYSNTLGDQVHEIFNFDDTTNDGKNRAYFYVDDRAAQEYAYFYIAGNTATSYAKSFDKPPVGIWYHYVFSYNDTSNNFTIYINGVKNESGTFSDDIAVDGCFEIGQDGDLCAGTATRSAFGMMDQLNIYNRGLTDAEANDQYNGGTGVLYPSGVAPPPVGESSSINISEAIPANNTIWSNEILNFNATINASNQFNCTLYINDTINQTLNEFGSGINVGVDFNVTFGSDEVNKLDFTIGCWDGINDTNSTENRIWIDRVLPLIQWYRPYINNNSAFYWGNDNFVTNISLEDPNLYSFNYNITYPNGTLIYNRSNSSLSGRAEVNITDIINYSNFTGEIWANMRVCDGHTDRSININARKEDNMLLFDDVKIYLNTRSDTEDLWYGEQTDRYSFGFETKTPSAMVEFIVESDKFIDIMNERSVHLGHLITGDKWIDFESAQVNNIITQRLDYNKVRLIITGDRAYKIWQFNSIGELNCKDNTKSFWIYNISSSFSPSEAISTQTGTYYFNITPFNSSYIDQYNAQVQYNGSYLDLTGTDYTTYYTFSTSFPVPTFTYTTNITLNYNATIGGYWIGNIFSDYITTAEQNQTLYYPAIDNCTIYTIPFVNYTIADEDTSAVTNGTITYQFNWQFNNITGVYSGTQSNNTYLHSFCLWPNFANFSTNVSLTYALSPISVIQRSYSATNFGIDNQTDSVNLLLLSNPTDITIHLIDDSDNNLQGYTIEAWRYDSGNDTDTLVQSEVTDPDGNVLLGLKYATTQYHFEFYLDGVLKLNTTRFKIFSTEYEFVISSVEESILENIVNYRRLTKTNLTYDNATNIVRYDYAYTGSKNGTHCLKVAAINTTEYFNVCDSNTTGTIQYTITAMNISYLATGYVNIGGNQIVLKTLPIDTTGEWRKWGSFGLAMAFIILIMTSMLGLVDKNVGVLATSFALAAIIWFGLIPLASSWIIMIGVITAVILIILNRRAN